MDLGDKRSGLNVLKSNGLVASIHRRPPSQSHPAGNDVLLLDASGANGEMAIFMSEFDKHGQPLKGQQLRMLLWLTQHAVESLFQRLKTTNPSAVFEELRSISSWLYANRWNIGIYEGILLTRSGFFLVYPASTFAEPKIDRRPHWDATTWVSDGQMEDHTPGKSRIAAAVRNARENGMVVGFVRG